MGDLRVLQMSRQSLDWPRHRVLHKSPHLKSLRPFAAPIKANAALFDIRVALVRRLFARSHSSPHSSRIYRSRIVQHNFVAPSRRVALRRDAPRSATRFAALKSEPLCVSSFSSLIIVSQQAPLARVEAHITRSPPRCVNRLRGRRSELFGRWLECSALNSQKTPELLGHWLEYSALSSQLIPTTIHCSVKV